MLVSGIPTIMIALGSLALSFAALLTIIDHYDKRPNEHHYHSIKKILYKAAFFLIILAPLIEILESIMLLQGIHVFPRFNGFAGNYTFYSPELNNYIPYIDALLENSLLIVGVSIMMIVIGVMLKKFFQDTSKKYIAILMLPGFIGMSYVFILFLIKDFLSGVVEENSIVYTAVNEPAKFNAILLTQFIIAISMFLASFIAFIAVITNRLKLVDEA